jgi:hypothetical protein
MTNKSAGQPALAVAGILNASAGAEYVSVAQAYVTLTELL